MNKNKLWLTVAIISLVFGIASVGGIIFCSGKTQGIEDLEVSTGVKNHSLAYDREKDILYIGTHDNDLVAFQEGEELWRTTANGAYSDLFLDTENDRLYAANEDTHVYVYQASDGNQLLDVNIQRKVVALDVNKDRSKIAIITNTGSNKANLIVLSAEGDELQNKQYNTQVGGVKYCSDGETLLISNKRGEVLHLTEAGEQLNILKTGYEVIQMIRNGDSYWLVNKSGAYFEFDETLKILREGKIDNTVKAVVRSIGVDDEGEYVLVGTREGYLYVMDGQDKQIYTANLNVEIKDFEPMEGGIYVTGYGDFVKILHVENLATMDQYMTMYRILRTALYVLIVLFVIGVIEAIPRTRRATIKVLKSMWKHKMAYIMLLPTFLLVFFFNYRGIFTALTRAFTDWSATNNTLAKMSFIGLDNFRMMLEEGFFLVGMKNLVLLLVTGLLKTLTVPLLVAWLVFSIRGDRRKYVHRFLFVLPIVVPGVVGAMTWQKIYDPSIGLLNELLGAMNLENLQRVWLGDAKTAIWAVIFMGFPFVGAMAFLVYYGGFINIGADVIESALIDGGNKWNIFWRIQLPMIRPQISIMITLQILGTMQDFNGIFILTSGGPGTATYVPALELYLNASQYGRYGYASALGVVLLIFTLTVTVLSNRLSRERE